ncbi:MAG: DUF3126 family protein [Rhodospirillaceae bacterium]|jgi:hypothetical protein|nr:DUF3126 family protein [Rhodospirillales bacterium]
MQPAEIAKIQAYMRQAFGSERLNVRAPDKKGGPVEVNLGDEFIGVLHRDDDEGEISYAFHMTILAEDL